MKNLRSHFVYTKNQRSGILILLGLIVVMQCVYHFVDFEVESNFDFDLPKTIAFQKQLDSLKQIAIENRKPKIYPFNPNFISDYKGYQLGMSTEQIDRLHQFRAKNRYVNSTKEFQQVTRISDSLLQKISPYFKFPDWVTKNKTNTKKATKRTFNHETKKVKDEISTTDINLATMNDFLSIDGVDDYLSERIIKYRTKLQGFTFSDQIFEVWRMDKEVGNKILETFSIKTVPAIKKINVNTATFKEVLKIPYIDYDLCVKIFNYRDEVAELQSISELKNIEDFPIDKYDRIVVYLQAE